VSEREWSAWNIAWMSAHETVGHGSTQTRVVGSVVDRRGEPPEWDKVISETTTAPHVLACRFGSVFSEPTKRRSLFGIFMVSGEPALNTIYATRYITREQTIARYINGFRGAGV